MSGGAPEKAIELHLKAVSSRYDPGDPRWATQVADLSTSINREVGGVTQRGVPGEGQKGAVADVVLALGASGAFGTFLATARAWLARDQTRSLEISWNVDGEERTVQISGDAIDNEAMHVLAEAAARRLGGAPTA